VKRGAEKVRKEIENEGKDHQGLPVQIVNTSQKCSVAELGTKNKVPMKTLHVHILPLFAPSKRPWYGKQIETLDWFRLFLLEMLHRRVEIEKQCFRKESSGKGLRTPPTSLQLPETCPIGGRPEWNLLF